MCDFFANGLNPWFPFFVFGASLPSEMNYLLVAGVRAACGILVNHPILLRLPKICNKIAQKMHGSIYTLLFVGKGSSQSMGEPASSVSL
jgi:hypothetical protein